MEIYPVTPVYIQKKLRGISDAGDCLKGMPAPQQREICHCIQLKQIRTGHAEKVAHHQVCVPYGLKRRQTVKHIERILSLLSDPVMDIHSKRLKPLIGVKLADLKSLSRCEKWFMIGETHIDQISPVPDRLLRKRYCKKLKILQIRYAPDYVVPHPDII